MYPKAVLGFKHPEAASPCFSLSRRLLRLSRNISIRGGVCSGAVALAENPRADNCSPTSFSAAAGWKSITAFSVTQRVNVYSRNRHPARVNEDSSAKAVAVSNVGGSRPVTYTA